MNKAALVISAAIATFTAAAHAAAVEPAPSMPLAAVSQHKGARTETFAGVKPGRHLLQATRESDGPLTADFTVEGADALSPVVTENFDAGLGAWQCDPTQYVEWTVKRIAAPGDAKSFSNIDPDDVSSLFVEGPYQTFRREKSSATSPQYDIPAKAVLSFYVGFSRNYDDVCRLELTAVTPSETIVLWNSKEVDGPTPWAWHPVTLNLDGLAGEKVAFRFTYTWGSKDESFQTGGYLGDFAIDGFVISSPQAVESLSVMTGEEVALVDMSAGEPTAWQWIMPGATPSASTEKNPRIVYTRDGEYDITLTVSDAEGHTATRTRTAFVKVTGLAPVAHIVPPSTFRFDQTRLPMVAPLAPVTWHDGSENYPDSWSWTFTGLNPDSNVITTSTEENPTVSYAFQHRQGAFLEVSNAHGTSTDMAEVSVEYSGAVNNLLPDDKAATFDMEDWGVFPGSNTSGITAYAEHFSAPSRPIVVDGAYVYFTESTTTEVVDQIANIGCHIYTCKDGKPDKRLDSMWWSAFELDLPGAGSSSLVGTAFPFTERPVITDEFFIVVDGIPEYKEGCRVSFAMADFRDSGNTAMILKNGEWMEVSRYFGADKQTSFMMYPSIIHSVIAPLPQGAPAELTVGATAGSADFDIFSIMGYQEPVESDASWMRVTSTANGMTVDKLVIGYDALPAGVESREGHLTVTDGADSLVITVTQNRSSGVTAIETDDAEADDAEGMIYTLDGCMVGTDRTQLQPGVYILRQADTARKIVIR